MARSADMTVTVLGSSGGFPAGGCACSGYLVRAAERTVLLDCGPGIARELFAVSERCTLDEVVVTHLHQDHVLDLVPLAYALLGEWITHHRIHPLTVRVPVGGRDLLGRLSELFGHRLWRLPREDRGPGHAALRAALDAGGDWLLEVFDIVEYIPGDAWTIGDIAVITRPTVHSVPNGALRLEAGGRVLGYTGDTRWDPGLAAHFAGADLLLADAHLSSEDSPGGAHMTPGEAGRMAAAAGVGTLVLCHLGSPADGDAALAEAASAFGGTIRLAFRDREHAL